MKDRQFVVHASDEYRLKNAISILEFLEIEQLVDAQTIARLYDGLGYAQAQLPEPKLKSSPIFVQEK